MKTWKVLGLLGITLGATVGHAGSLEVETALMSGEVSRYVNRHETSHDMLAAVQLQSLTGWLKEHASGWNGMVTPPSNEPIDLYLRFKHRDGTTTDWFVVARVNGGHYLRVTGSGKWVYESLGGIFKYSAATRPLSDQDLTALEKLTRAM